MALKIYINKTITGKDNLVELIKDSIHSDDEFEVAMIKIQLEEPLLILTAGILPLMFILTLEIFPLMLLHFIKDQI